MNKAANILKIDGNSDLIFRRNALFLFLILPVTGLINSLMNKDNEWAKNLFWFFCIFFGFTFVIAEEGGADSDRYAQLLLYFAHSKMSLDELWRSFYSVTSGYVDVVSPLITFLVSRVTDNASILFMIYGIIFGYFYSRNIWFILSRIEGKLSWFVLLLFLSFALFNPIWNINGFRFWAAAQVFLYGTLPYLLDGKKKYLFWSFFAVFIHFSFIGVIGILGLFVAIRNRLNLFLVIFIITSFIREIDLQWMRTIFSFLPEFLYTKVFNYTNPDYAEERRFIEEELPWFITYSSIAIRWVNYILVLAITLIDRQTFRERNDLKTLLCFALLVYSFSNLSSLVPSGQRFIIVANTFMFASFILYFATAAKEGSLLFVRIATIPLQLLYCLVAIRIGMDFFSIMTVIGNPVSAIFYSDPAPLIQDIKNLF